MAFGNSVRYYVVILTVGVETKIPFREYNHAIKMFNVLTNAGYDPMMIRESVSQEVVFDNG